MWTEIGVEEFGVLIVRRCMNNLNPPVDGIYVGGSGEWVAKRVGPIGHSTYYRWDSNVD